jgi:hypothetical protein
MKNEEMINYEIYNNDNQEAYLNDIEYYIDCMNL